jgi:hypothetical protein
LQSPIVHELVSAAKDAMDALRDDISDVTAGPIVDGVEYVNFKFRGEHKSMPLANPNHLVIGDGRMSDRSIALQAMLAPSKLTQRVARSRRRKRRGCRQGD